MAEVHIRPALAAQEVGVRLIREHHIHLEEARILWLFTTAKRKKCDRVRLASAKKLSAMERYLSSGNESVETGYDFIGLIGVREWEGLTDQQRVALVDHELCHMAVFLKDGELNRWRRFDPNYDVLSDEIEWRYGVRGHDLEEFTEVIERHGLWSADRQEFAEAATRARQLRLAHATEGLQAAS
jgi:hypothetical protein